MVWLGHPNEEEEKNPGFSCKRQPPILEEAWEILNMNLEEMKLELRRLELELARRKILKLFQYGTLPVPNCPWQSYDEFWTEERGLEWMEEMVELMNKFVVIMAQYRLAFLKGKLECKNVVQEIEYDNMVGSLTRKDAYVILEQFYDIEKHGKLWNPGVEVALAMRAICRGKGMLTRAIQN